MSIAMRLVVRCSTKAEALVGAGRIIDPGLLYFVVIYVYDCKMK